MRAGRVAGAVLALAGLGLGGAVGWEYVGTNLVAERHVEESLSVLDEQWSSAPAMRHGTEQPLEAGEPFAVLRLPRLGDWRYPIVVGTGDAELSRGIGWYPQTALPGEVGNFAVAGHRVTHGEPFARLLELRVGDEAIVETATTRYVYRVTTAPSAVTVTDADGGWVLRPVPGRDTADAQPTTAVITLTTCAHRFSSPERSVGFGELVHTEPRVR